MEKAIKKLTKLTLKHPELAQALSPQRTTSTPPSASSTQTSSNADGGEDKATDGNAAKTDESASGEKKLETEPIDKLMAKKKAAAAKPAASQGDYDLDSSDSSSSSRPRPPHSSKRATAKRNAELGSYAAMDAKRKQHEIMLRQITPFSEAERKTLEAFTVARRARRGTRPGNGASLGVVFYNDPVADAEFFDIFERFIVVHADHSTNWHVVSFYIAEYVTWFNNLAADLTNYTIPELREAWSGNDQRSSGMRNDLWARAKELAGAPPARPAAASGGSPCPYCGKLGHSFINCKARKAKLKEEKAKLKKSEGGTRSDSESDTAKASGSKKKTTKKSG